MDVIEFGSGTLVLLTVHGDPDASICAGVLERLLGRSVVVSFAPIGVPHCAFQNDDSS